MSDEVVARLCLKPANYYYSMSKRFVLSVAKRLVEKGEMKIGKSCLRLSWPPADSYEPNPCCILVENVTSEDLLETLELKLESVKVGGGQIELFTPQLENDCVLVKFVDEQGLLLLSSISG